MSLNASSRIGFFLRRIVAVFLALSLFSNYSLAAPEASRYLVVRAVQGAQDLKLDLATVELGSFLHGLAYNFFFLFRDKQEGRDIAKIEVSPGPTVKISQGHQINFLAIGYDTKDIPVGGVKYDWTIAYANTEGDATEYLLPDGTFSALTPGDYVITASAEGLRSQVNVTVEENEPLMTLRRIKDDEATGKTDFINSLKAQGLYTSTAISSKKVYNKQTKASDVSPEGVSQAIRSKRSHGPSPDEDESELDVTKPNSKNKMIRRPANEDGWNDNNWWLADDPGNQPGTPPGTSPEAAAGNGNFQFSTPVVSLPGRGIDISLFLNYNSRVWSKAGTTMSFDAERGYPAPGWNLGFGKMMFMGAGGGCMLIDADGTNHGYTGTITTYTSSISFTGHTTDGTFIDYTCAEGTSGGVTTMLGTASRPNGTQVSYNVNSANGKQAFPTQITDAQGNYINIAYRNSFGPEIQTVTDTLGRAITFNYDSSTPARLISIDVPKMDNAGTRTALRLHYHSLTLNPGWDPSMTSDTNNANPNVVDAIYYPGTSTGYWFGADPIAADYNTYYSSYGMIAKVVEQRGMGWSGTAGNQGNVTAGTMSKQAVYSYPLSPIYTLTDAPTYDTLTESWAGMDTDPVITTYELHMNDNPRTITVSQPHTAAQGVQVKSKQTMYNAPGVWNDGLIYQDETLDGSSNQLAKSVVAWEQGAYDSPRPTETQATDEAHQILRTTYTYGTSYNQVTSQKQYDYDLTTVLKDTRTSYQNGTGYTNRHIFSLVTSTEIYDGNNIRQSKTDYTYDGATLTAAPNVTMFKAQNDPYNTQMYNTGVCLNWINIPGHGSFCSQWQILPVFQSWTLFRGNVTQITGYADAVPTAPGGPISQTKQYDIAGNVVAESASCCELKTYVYDDPNTPAIDTQYAYPLIQTRGSSDPNSTIRNTSTAVYDFYTGLIKQSTDPNGRITTTTYDADTLRPTQTTASTGAYTQTTYDESAMTVTDEVFDQTTSGPVTAGKTTKYLNGLGLITRKDDIGPSNVADITETKYNQLAKVWKQSRPYRTGDTVQWSEKFYDLQGRVTKLGEPDGSETKAAYNETQRPDTASGLGGSTIRVTDAWGRERWGRYDALGRLSEVAEPNLASTGKPVNVALAANGATATASSEYSGSYSAANATNGDRNGTNWTNGGGWLDATSGTYPDWLEVDFNGSQAIGEIDVFTVQDNYTNPVNPTDSMTFATYGIKDFDVQYWNGSSWVTISGGSVTNNDKVWRKFTFSSITTSKIRVVVNNALASSSRITEVEAWTPTTSTSITGSVFNGGSFVTNYSYDTMGNLTGTNQGGQVRSFKYDSLGRLIRQKLAEQTATINDAGTYVGAGGTWSSAFLYDDRSNVTQKTDARGVQIKYSYQLSGGSDDPLNRLQSVTYDLNGTHDASKPIPTAPTVTYEYMTAGDQDRLKKVTAAGVSTDELAYDTEGRVTNETKTLLTRTNYPMATSYTYDSLGRTATMTLPKQYGLTGDPQKTVQYFYDTSSRLTTLKYGSTLTGYTQQAGNLNYNAAGQTTSIDIGPTVNEQYTFDPQTGLLTNQKAVRNGTTPLLDLTYDYNRNNSIGSLNGKTGHLTRLLDNLNHYKDREYQFDAVGRLTVAKGGANGTRSQQSYGYDRFGNRTSLAATGVAADNTTMPTDGIPTLTFNTTNNNNQITTSNANGAFEYDVAGNQTRALAQDGVNWIRYEYDAANRPVNIKQGNGPNDGTPIESQQFGVGNERIALTDTVANQTTWYGNAVEYTENNGNGTLAWSKTCTYLGDSLLSTIIPDGAGNEMTEYNHPDRLGTKLVTNQAAGTSYEQSHLPFGKALDAESTLTTNPKRFTSYERSTRAELDYAVNRTYDSKQGRFTQVDPLGMGSVSLASPQTLNLFVYCGNDPINHLDPSGLGFFSFLKKVFKWAMLAIAIVAAVLTIVGAIIGVAALSAFLGNTVLGQILSFIENIPGLIGSSVFGGTAGSIAGALGFVDGAVATAAGLINGMLGWALLAASKATVGAIANNFAKNKARSNSDECDHWLKFYYPFLKKYFDMLWDKTESTKSDSIPAGKEAGGAIYISNSNVSLGGIEETGMDVYDGPTDANGMGDAFNDWVIEEKRVLGLRNYTVLIVHTHPGEVKIIASDGDFLKAKNNPEARMGQTEIQVYNGKKVICTISR